MDTLFVGYMGIALAELDILIYNIENFANINSTEGEKLDSAVDRYLSTCCKHHNQIIECVEG